MMCRSYTHHHMSLRSGGCARTDIDFYDFAVRRPIGPTRAVPKAHEFFDERVRDAMMISAERLEAILRRITPADVELMSPCLGKGMSSTEYLCSLLFAPAQTFVAKVPNPVAMPRDYLLTRAKPQRD